MAGTSGWTIEDVGPVEMSDMATKFVLDVVGTLEAAD